MTTHQTNQDDLPTTAEKETASTESPALEHLSYEELIAQFNETEAQLNEARLAIEDYKNQLLRNHAELDNVRKRANKDVQSAHRYGAESLVTALLPVIDSLERGMAVETNDNALAKQIHAGLEMTLKLLTDTLEKSSIKPIDPLHEPFDPTFHQAISTQEDPSVSANTVLQVLQKGYQLHDRLIRPALVIVSK